MSTKEELSTDFAYSLGQTSKLLENPFWKDYPKNPGSHEATLGRWFVEGWLSAL